MVCLGLRQKLRLPGVGVGPLDAHQDVCEHERRCSDLDARPDIDVLGALHLSLLKLLENGLRRTLQSKVRAQHA